MSGFRPGWPAAPAFHPEFGLLCPSPRARRGLRAAAVALVVGASISATMGLAGAHWRDSEATASVSVDEGPVAVDFRAPLADVGTTGPARGHDCKAVVDDLSASFLNQACAMTRPHARHGGHVASRVSTFILGRTDAARQEAAEAPAVMAATDPSEKVAASPAPGALQPALPVKKPKAKPRAATAIAAQGGVSQDPKISAYAPMPRFGAGSNDPYSPVFRAMPPGSGSPFGRSW